MPPYSVRLIIRVPEQHVTHLRKDRARRFQTRKTNTIATAYPKKLSMCLPRCWSCGVIARTSTFAFRGKEQDLRAIGEKLRVGMILEGSVPTDHPSYQIISQLSFILPGGTITHIENQTLKECDMAGSYPHKFRLCAVLCFLVVIFSF